MKCQKLFSGENKKNITNVLSTELAWRVVKVKGASKIAADDILLSLFFTVIFQRE